MIPLAEYANLVKLRTVLLMTFCSATAYVIAGGLFLSLESVILLVATSMGVAGSCAIHNYLDMDIDSIMERTRKRPLPAGKICPINAVLVGTILLFAGMTLAFLLNFLTFVFALLACFFYLLVYTSIAKRRNPVNIILGSPAGGLPVLAGWSATTGTVDILGFLLAILVIIWIPNHIWNIAAVWSDDYKRTKIPMIPVVSPESARKCTLSTVILLFLLTVYLYLGGFFGFIYLVVTLPLGSLLVLGNLYVFHSPSKKGAYRMFKFSSIYLAVIFLSMILDLAFT